MARGLYTSPVLAEREDCEYLKVWNMACNLELEYPLKNIPLAINRVVNPVPG